jgi:glycosyltransferase 2 family protein
VTDDASARNRTRRTILTIVQIVFTLGAFTYLFTITDVESLRGAMERAPWFCVPAILAVLFVVLFAAAVRWRLLFTAYGASAPPPLLTLFRLQLVGLFYNMLPGAVGGDVVRGVVSRSAFGERGLSAGLAIVLVERLLGLIGLVILVLTTLTLHEIPKLPVPRPLLLLGLLGGIVAIGGIAAGRRLAKFLPGKLADLASQLPELTGYAAFATAIAMSVLNHALIGVVGHIVISPLAPHVVLLDSVVLSPLSFATIFVPVTVAGAGTRDAAMIALYGTVGVARSDALLGSLEILLAYVLLAGTGGVVGALYPLQAAPTKP